MEELKDYAGLLTLVVGSVSGLVTWLMMRGKVNMDAKTSIHEQQRLNMEQLLKQNHELAHDLGVLRSRMAELHEECAELRNEVKAMKAWFHLRSHFCKDCELFAEGLIIFGEPTNPDKNEA